MTNEEIDESLRRLGAIISKHEKKLYSELPVGSIEMQQLYGIRSELELLNMSIIVAFTMLGEIVKRMPEGGQE